MELDLTRAPLTRKVWKNRRVLILGLGQFPQGSGISAALLFARLGAQVTVTDLKKAKELGTNVQRLKRFKNVRFVLGRHDLKDVRRAAFIVPNQRVRHEAPEMRLARKLGIPICTEIALFLNHCPASAIGVTGTRGKSTTTALIAHILSQPKKKNTRRVWLGGNILVSPLTFLSRMRPGDIVVLELSSFQTESLADARPVDIAVVTNIMRDHLNAYADMEEYAEAKAGIFRNQHPRQTVVFNRDDAHGQQWASEAPSRVVTFGARDRLPVKQMDLLLEGSHNVMNALAAMRAATAAGATRAQITKGLKTFKPLPNRLETVRVWRDIRFVNDTTATTPDGTIAAIDALNGRGHHHLWVIMGGADKELTYEGLEPVIARHYPHIHILLLPGDASEKIKKALPDHAHAIHPVNDIADAIRVARRSAVPGDTVVLSPGAASFNQYANEFERGKVFVQAVKEL